ncbi:hypothetical protein MP228_011118 [Amoeboaphelidium protococcarum]|nr:hypothetical protein MP228_011118 [Amoeboaphelidium protococcarum]
MSDVDNPFESAEIIVDQDKRIFIVDEMCKTEQDYHDSLQRLCKQCFGHSAEFKAELSVYVDPVVEFSQQMFQLLSACGNQVIKQSDVVYNTTLDVMVDGVIDVFNNMCPQMELVYSGFTSHYTQMMRFIQQQCQSDEGLKQELQAVNQALQGDIDVTAVLLKPVQRILKYPLFISDLMKCYQSSQDTSTMSRNNKERIVRDLSQVLNKLQQVSENINRAKKTQEMVQSVGKRRNVLHYVQKNLNRKTQYLKSAAGLTMTESNKDILIEEIEFRVQKYSQLIEEFRIRSQQALRGIFFMLKHLIDLVAAFEEVAVIHDDIQSVEFLLKVRKLKSDLSVLDKVQLESLIYLEDLHESIQSVTIVLTKRSKKLLDYDRFKELEVLGQPIDAGIRKAAEEYVLYNEAIAKECPLLFNLIDLTFLHIVNDVSEVQNGLLHSVMNCLEMTLPIEKRQSAVVKEYRGQIRDAQQQLASISVLQRLFGGEAVPSPKPRSFSHHSILIDRDSILSSQAQQDNQRGQQQSYQQSNSNFLSVNQQGNDNRLNRSKSANELNLIDFDTDYNDIQIYSDASGGAGGPHSAPLKDDVNSIEKLMALFSDQSFQKDQESSVSVTSQTLPRKSSLLAFSDIDPLAKPFQSYQVQCIYPYKAQNDDEISVDAGTECTVLQETTVRKKRFLLCKCGAQQGLVPEQHFTKI